MCFFRSVSPVIPRPITYSRFYSNEAPVPSQPLSQFETDKNLNEVLERKTFHFTRLVNREIGAKRVPQFPWTLSLPWKTWNEIEIRLRSFQTRKNSISRIPFTFRRFLPRFVQHHLSRNHANEIMTVHYFPVLSSPFSLGSEIIA